MIKHVLSLCEPEVNMLALNLAEGKQLEEGKKLILKKMGGNGLCKQSVL